LDGDPFTESSVKEDESLEWNREGGFTEPIATSSIGISHEASSHRRPSVRSKAERIISFGISFSAGPAPVLLRYETECPMSLPTQSSNRVKTPPKEAGRRRRIGWESSLRSRRLSWFKPSTQERLGWTIDKSVEEVGGYLYSRLLLTLINGLGFFAVMVAVGVPFGLAIPLAIFGAFVSEFIPNIGTYLGAAIPIALTLALQGLVPALIVLGYALVYQQIENYWLNPKISAKTMELNGGLAFGAALAGGALFGPMGAFMALPVAALIYSFIKNYQAGVPGRLCVLLRRRFGASRERRDREYSDAWIRGSHGQEFQRKQEPTHGRTATRRGTGRLARAGRAAGRRLPMRPATGKIAKR